MKQLMDFRELQNEFQTSLAVLNSTGIMCTLPVAGTPGVIGIDQGEYPAPTLDQVQELFSLNWELVNRKTRQGFTRLLLTPLAVPILQFMDRAAAVIQEHAAADKIFQTRRDDSDPRTPVQVNTLAPLWIWQRVRHALDTPSLVYFPKTYSISDHQGFKKTEVICSPRFCGVPGWSIGLVEPLPLIPSPRQGRVLAGRAQLESGSSPREYLQTLNSPVYEAETGWTPEDFLTYFITRLELTNQVSHDRQDDNALWLLGTYLPDLQPTPHIVPVGYWSSAAGHKLYLSAHRTGNHLGMCGARTIVRLVR